jgi:hypothetical protein
MFDFEDVVMDVSPSRGAPSPPPLDQPRGTLFASSPSLVASEVTGGGFGMMMECVFVGFVLSKLFAGVRSKGVEQWSDSAPRNEERVKSRVTLNRKPIFKAIACTLMCQKRVLTK